MEKMTKFVPKFNSKALIIVVCISIPIILFGNPEFGGGLLGITSVYLVKKYYKEKKLKRKVGFWEAIFGFGKWFEWEKMR
jgi:hypothetical protein